MPYQSMLVSSFNLSCFRTKRTNIFRPFFIEIFQQKSPLNIKDFWRKRGFYNHNLLQFTNVFIPTEHQLFTQIKI